jgi:hypothetical protein
MRTGFTVTREDPEWHHMWSLFDVDLLNQGEEQLEYMGTVASQCGPGYVHQFRHRGIPGQLPRQYWAVVASEGWVPREIVMEQHLARLGA